MHYVVRYMEGYCAQKELYFMDIQKASVWKRAAAGLLDAMLLLLVAAGIFILLLTVFNYDGYNAQSEALQNTYLEEYNIDPSWIGSETLTPEQQQIMMEAETAFGQDEKAYYLFNMLTNILLLSISMSALVGLLLLEFVLPLILGNGQTVGKKVFSISVTRVDGVKLTTLQLFVRTLLGRFTIETMFPAYIIIMIIWGSLGMVGTVILVALLLLQLILMAATQNRSLIHDLLAGTVVVDHMSQKIFRTTDDLIAHKKRIAAEHAARQEY